MKKILSMILCLITLLSFTAIPLKAEAPDKVYDNAGLLSSEKIGEFEQHLKSFRETYDIDLVIATTTDIEDMDAFVYAENFYDQNQIGMGNGMDGGLLMIDMDNREVVFFTSGKLRDIINDSQAQSITDSLISYLGDESYDLAAEQFITAVSEKVEIAAAQTETPEPDTGDLSHSTGETADPIPKTTVKQSEPIRPFDLIVVIVPSLLIFFIGTGVVKFRYKHHSSNENYGKGLKGNLQVTEREDHFIRTDRTQRHIPKPPPPRPSGSRSSSSSRGGASSSFGSSSRGSSSGSSKSTGGGRSKF